MFEYDRHKRNALVHGLGGDEGRNVPHSGLDRYEFPVNESLWFNQKKIKLDGWCFKGCRFDACLIVIETPHFVLKNCYIDERCTIELQGMLINVVQLMNLDRRGPNPVFHAVHNPDGTVSIGG